MIFLFQLERYLQKEIFLKFIFLPHGDVHITAYSAIPPKCGEI